ncbi:DDE-type integrase/transposase/recombinase, partial [Haloferula sp. A504]|uniref:DDE-type integrase/transposase/recombinase n=1 Tax=Haloferula sp. A504 TaxID=3373601 RepID=UPI0031C71160|nr:DDE-type integrase/transposase/recombinase [Verrucomicrobiaceae bacterium E54]
YQAVSEMIFQDEDGQPHQFTWRTIQTWWYYYRRHGITENPVRSDKGTVRKVSPEEVLAAIEKALPSFRQSTGKGSPRPLNIQALYRACIEQGHLIRSRIAPNTFRRIVNRYELLKPDTHQSPKRRLAFAKAHANDLWQTDTLHGPYLRFHRHQKSVQVFLIAFIDDASRVITHGQFFAADNTENLIECFQNALYKRGVPQAIYADNGSNYSSKEFAQICTRLGTVLIHTPVRDGASKGKIERFFRTVRDQFLERNLDSISCLEELNEHFTRWVEDEYHTREHSTLGMRPLDRFGLDLGRIRHLQHCSFNEELFFLEATRKVRTDNTFHFQKIRYEAPRDLRGKTITIRYSRFIGTSGHPIAYFEGERLGSASPVDFIDNDRKPHLGRDGDF